VHKPLATHDAAEHFVYAITVHKHMMQLNMCKVTSVHKPLAPHGAAEHVYRLHLCTNRWQKPCLNNPTVLFVAVCNPKADSGSGGKGL
jgi:hypothetical protein